MVLSPSGYVNNTLLSNPVISWQRRSGGGSFTSTLIDGESVNNNALTVNKNILASDENKIITYKCTVTYGDITRSEEISYSLNIVGQEVAALSDFVVQKGTSGNWYYRKWNSGRAECWGNIPINTAITSSIGSIYYAEIENIAFPSGLFINKPLVFANSTSTAVLTVAIRGSTTTKSVFGINLMYPVSYPNAITWEVAVEARGTWK